MSAKKWSACPQCLARAVAAKEAAVKAADAAYGKVSLAEYVMLIEAAQRDIEYEATLQEDYEIFVGEQGKFHVSYWCHCEQCGFDFSFKHEEQVKTS